MRTCGRCANIIRLTGMAAVSCVTPMAFAIQWTGPNGPASTQRKEPVDALRYAMQMLAKGYANVVIVDLAEDGKAYAPAEFASSIWIGENNTR